MQDSGQPEDAGTAKPEGARFRVTWMLHQPAPREREFGETRKLKLKAKPEGAARGATRSHTGRRCWRAKLRGNPRLKRRKRRRTRNSRQLEDPSPAKPEDAVAGATRGLIGRRNWKSEDSGRPGVSSPVALKDARFEATRKSIAGKAGRCRSRGNPGTHREARRVD
jgi:hypothetical protein